MLTEDRAGGSDPLVGPVLVPPVEDGEDVGGDGGWEGESQVGDDGDDLHPAGPGVVLAS